MSSSDSIQALALFRASLAINNTGVSILEQGHARDAQKTFRESLILMKQACSNPTAAACERIEETLQSASARLVRAQNTPVHAVFEICAIEDGDALSNTIKSGLRYGPSSSQVFPIRVRTTAGQDDGQFYEMQMKRPTAIVLYNQGLAHLLWGQCVVMYKSAIQQQHYSAALSCFSVAQGVLSQHMARMFLTEEHEHQHQDVVFEKQCSLIVQAFVVNSLVHIMRIKSRLGLFVDQPESHHHHYANRQNQQSKSQTLEEWIQVQNNILRECDSMDKRQQLVAPTSPRAATAA
jgi:hypothetical protein